MQLTELDKLTLQVGLTMQAVTVLLDRAERQDSGLRAALCLQMEGYFATLQGMQVSEAELDYLQAQIDAWSESPPASPP